MNWNTLALVKMFGRNDFSVDDEAGKVAFSDNSEFVDIKTHPNWNETVYNAAVQEQQFMDFVTEVRNYVGERILGHASQGTQMNMAAAAAAGILTPEQMQAFQEGLMWVAATRAKGKEVIQNKIFDFKNADWPEPTAGAVALAEAY